MSSYFGEEEDDDSEEADSKALYKEVSGWRAEFKSRRST
jgi:hypothetical protein